MRKTKRRMETLSFYDRTGVERHLEQMAEKGWMIDRVTSLGWVYRRIEPKKLRFAVTYYPKASDFDPGPSEGQQVYHAFSAHAGWKYVCSWAQMQIFCTDQPDPVPIETDPEIELETIHAAMVKGFLVPYGILLAIGLLWIAMLVHDLWDDPIGLFSSATNLFMAVVWPLLGLLCIVEIVAYLCWRARARKAAARGEFVDTPNTRPFQRVVFTVCAAAFIVQLLYNVTTGSPVLRVVSILMVLYMLVLMAAVQGVKQMLKRKKVSRGVNRAVTITVDVVLAFGMMAAIVFGTLRATQNGWLDTKTAVEASPLTLEELWRNELPEADYHSDWTETAASPLVAVYDVRERGSTNGADVFIPSLDYTVTEVKLPALYGRCRAQLLEKEISLNWRQVSFSTKRIATPCDAAPWGANEAWQVAWENEIPSDDYLLCYDRNLVEISFSWTPTDEQKALVGEKLGDL